MHVFLGICVCGFSCASVPHGMTSLTILQVCPMLIRVFPQVRLLPPRLQSSCIDFLQSKLHASGRPFFLGCSLGSTAVPSRHSDSACMLQFGGHHRLEDYARRGYEPKDEVTFLQSSMHTGLPAIRAILYGACLLYSLSCLLQPAYSELQRHLSARQMPAASCRSRYTPGQTPLCASSQIW